MGRLGHTGCYPGKKVRVVTHDGQVIVDRFKERSKKFIVLEQYGRVYKENIRVFSFYNARLDIPRAEQR